MRHLVSIPGLPVAQDSVWRRPKTRAAMLAAAGSAFLPATLMMHNIREGVLEGEGGLGVFVALFAFAVFIATWHEKHLMLRITIGALAGGCGGILAGLLHGAIDASLRESSVLVVTNPVGAMLPPTHWGIIGGFIGISYSLVVGKAHWLWGLGYGGLWGLSLQAIPTPAAAFEPVGGLATATSLGLTLGFLNQWLQPPPRPASKIVALHEYKPRRRGRSGGRRLR